MSFKFNVKDIDKISNYENMDIKYDFYIDGVSSSSKPKSKCLMFSKQLTEESKSVFKDVKDSIIIISKDCSTDVEVIKENNLVIYVDNPRREYAIILTFILQFSLIKLGYKTLENNIVLGKNTIIGKNVSIEPGVFIDNNVEIGNNCVIMSGARIKQYVKIGNNAVIRENCVIGGEGYGVERDDDGFTVRIPHLGGVIIGDNVEIGALTAVAAGTIEPTIIDDYVKVDNLVHIAHNCKIGRGSMIIACSEISGSTEIGENVWVAPNACVINKVKIGSNSTVGMGSVVIKDVKEGTVVTGNPAEPIENIKKFNSIKKKLIKDFEDNK